MANKEVDFRLDKSPETIQKTSTIMPPRGKTEKIF